MQLDAQFLGDCHLGALYGATPQNLAYRAGSQPVRALECGERAEFLHDPGANYAPVQGST